MQPSAVLIWGFVAWQTLEALGSSIGTLLNASSIIRHQIFLAINFALVCFFAKIALLYFDGYDFLPIVTLICYTAINSPATDLAAPQDKS